MGFGTSTIPRQFTSEIEVHHFQQLIPFFGRDAFSPMENNTNGALISSGEG